MSQFDISKIKAGPDGQISKDTVAALLKHIESVPSITVIDLTGKKPKTRTYDLKKPTPKK